MASKPPAGGEAYPVFFTPVKQDIIILLVIGVIVFGVSIWINAFETIHEYAQIYENYQVDELFSAVIIIVLGLLVFAWRRWKEFRTELKMRLQSEQGLLEANKKISLLTQITRHDIKNKIQTIYICADRLLHRGYEDIREDTTVILNETEAIDRLIMFTRDYENLGIKEPQWQNLGQMFEKCRELDSFRHIELESVRCDILIYADLLMQKVVFNLFDNAVRHGVHVTKITLTCTSSPDGQLAVHCSDNGVGIPAGMKSRIFDKNVGKNSGLGLFLAREILSLTGIGIEETGTEGNGADFLITVPSGSWKMAA